MVGHEVTIPFEKIELGGELLLPANATGLVLFAHGSGSSRFSPRNQFVARAIQEAGLGTLLFDLLTVEEEHSEARTGHLRFDIPLLAQRLLAATRWTLEKTADKELEAGYFGSSTGAAAALIAAAELNGAIKAVVSRGGRPDLAGQTLEDVTASTLLIVGGADPQVERLNEAAYQKLRCPKALRIIPGATHLFEEPGALEAVASLASEWFATHFKR